MHARRKPHCLLQYDWKLCSAKRWKKANTIHAYSFATTKINVTHGRRRWDEVTREWEGSWREGKWIAKAHQSIAKKMTLHLS